MSRGWTVLIALGLAGCSMGPGGASAEALVDATAPRPVDVEPAPSAAVGGEAVTASVVAAPLTESSVRTPVRERAQPAMPAAGPSPRNVMVVLIDDLASHQVQAYGPRPNQAATPTITRLAEEGVKFTRAYSFASCTPGRAALLTGRYPTRSGMGNAMDASDEDATMPLSEVTIPEMLRHSQFGYHSALIGKWHLSSFSYPGTRYNPNDQGFDYWSGTLENLGSHLIPGPATNYFRWEKITNGTPEIVNEYATTETTDDVLAQTAQLPEPWFILASYNAPHVPLHAPPANLHHQDLTGITCGPSSDPNAGVCYNAMLEAFDTELGRLLDSMDPGVLERTTIILTADNGTPEHGIFPPYSVTRDKGTLYDGGVQVPFIVTGPFVGTPGSETDAFVNIVDVFATTAVIADVDLSTLDAWDGSPLETDSVSFFSQLVNPGTPANPPRDQYVYSELFFDNGPSPYRIKKTMVRNAGYKIIRDDGVDEFYAYRPNQLDEGANLVEDYPPPYSMSADDADLTDIIRNLERTVVYEGP